MKSDNIISTTFSLRSDKEKPKVAEYIIQNENGQ
jgi:hypothetical protein